ncbi:MAG: IclR family transcriptional regulator [Desulfarculus sp.]|nr:MAG: IclR family transcriptional regulator [Desulfarculus sp.]
MGTANANQNSGDQPGPKLEDTKGAQSIHRAMALLRKVAAHNDQGATLSKLAREAGLHVATAHRILSVLVKEGLATHDPVAKLYHLGLELYQLGHAAHQYTVRDRFRNALEIIAQRSQDTVFLLIRLGNDVLCIDTVQGKYPVRTIVVDVGARRPLGIGAGSLSLIAFLPQDQFEAVVQANAPRYPNYKNLTADDIREMARKGRQAGYVLSDGLFHEDAVSVGVPIFDFQGGVQAAITVSAIRPRMSAQRREEIYQLVQEVVRAEGLSP